MDNEKDILVDQAFRDGLESFESNFETADWKDMERRLASDDKMVVIPPVKRNFKLLILIIMISTTTLTTALVLFNSMSEQGPNKTKSNEASVQSHNITDATSSETLSSLKAETVFEISTLKKQFSATNEQDLVNSFEQEEITENRKTSEKEESPNTNKVEELAERVIETIDIDTAKFMKKVVSRRWVDTTYRYTHVKPHKDIEQFWFGMYYTNQNLNNSIMWDEIGRRTETNGFNLQFMSGNVLPGENLAIYAGLDWGMQYYGRSKKDEVIINSVNEDRGVTFLRTHTNDIFATGHIEWTQFPVVPYVTGGLGIRILSTGQTTRTLVPSAEYESSQENGVFTRAALSYKAGFGVKLKLNPRIYLDTRYEIFQTDNLKAVDYTTTTYNGLDYDVSTKKVNLNSGQIRFGLVFDLSEEKREKYVDTPGHWEEETQYLYVDPSDSTKVFVPCPCDKPQKTRRSSNTQPSRNGGNDYPSNRGDNRISVPSGGGKSEFPGVKKPGKTW